MSERIEASFPEEVTSSLDIASCGYRWFIQRALNLRQKRKYERNLDFGSAFADGVYFARRAYYIEGKSEAQATKEAIVAADRSFNEIFFSAMQTAGKEEKIKTPDRLVSLLELYWKKFPLSKEVAAPFLFNDALSAEQAIKLKVTYPEYDFSYKIAVKPDMLVISQQGSVPIDEKTVTASATDKLPIYVYMMRGQFLLYSAVIQANIEDGTLCIPPLHSFEVRRAVLSRGVASGKDDAYSIKWKISEEKVQEFLDQFKVKMLLLKARVDKLNHPELESLEAQLKTLHSTRNHNACMEYNRPCPLLEHCAAGRELSFLGFKKSSINPLTKEVTFHE